MNVHLTEREKDLLWLALEAWDDPGLGVSHDELDALGDKLLSPVTHEDMMDAAREERSDG